MMNVSHTHEIVDGDKSFVIDPISRAITNTSEKVKLIQFDHDSERFTFQCPRMIEGHDMTLCNSIRVQYINLNKRTGQDNSGVYEIDDLAVDSEDSAVAKFSWLISQNATKFVGTLNFLIDFRCVDDDGSIVYAWHTDIYKGVTVSAGMDNGEVIEEKYPDILEKWKNEVMAAIPEVAPQTVKKIESLDKTNMTTIRSLDSGSYILYGYFKPYSDADTTIMFSSDILANIIKGKNDTQAQIFYPYDNLVQHFKITDTSYEKKNIYLDNVGVQSDWNQSDDTAVDYMKNRPGAYVNEEVFFSKEYPSGSFAEGYEEIDFSLPLQEGESYSVKIGQQSFDLICKASSSQVFLGDVSEGYIPIFEQYPFYIETNDFTSVIRLATAPQDDVEIKISKIAFVSLPEKFLPESVFMHADWDHISNKLVDFHEMQTDIIATDVDAYVYIGTTYSDVVNSTVNFVDGKRYLINGFILFDCMGCYEIDIDGIYECYDGRVFFGSFYDQYYRNNVTVSLCSADCPGVAGKVQLSTSGGARTYKINAKLTVIGDVIQLPDECLSDGIARTAYVLDTLSTYATKAYVDNLIGGIENGSY